MVTRPTRAAAAFAALAIAATLSLAACSGSSDAGASDAGSASASAVPSMSDSAVPSDSAGASDLAPVDAAGSSCEAYFKVDLLNSQYAGGAVAQGDLTEADARTQMQADLFEMNKQAKAAQSDGSGSPKLAKNALKMKKLIKALKAGAPLSALSKASQQNFATYSLRVQQACDALGYPLPDENVTARSSAGIKQ